jgi:hypothetical protein
MSLTAAMLLRNFALGRTWLCSALGAIPLPEMGVITDLFAGVPVFALVLRRRPE